jgi:hypothetical protein
LERIKPESSIDKFRETVGESEIHTSVLTAGLEHAGPMDEYAVTTGRSARR